MQTKRKNQLVKKVIKYKCCKCSSVGEWFYMPGSLDDYYCENCVPRGCSCMEGETDEQGRLLPCCEFEYKQNGQNKEFIKHDYKVVGLRKVIHIYKSKVKGIRVIYY